MPVAVKLVKVGVPPNAGEALKTTAPVPTSPITAVASCAVVNDPKSVALPVEVMAPVKLALVVTLPAVNPEAVPVILVPTSVDGVPRFGVVSIGDSAKTMLPVPVSSPISTDSSADESISDE